MNDVVIRVEGLGKKYRIRHQRPERYTALRDVIADKGRGLIRPRRREDLPAVEDFWALKDVSFEVKRGEVLGIIGRNGAGKTTLLRILSRITEPTEGRVELDGRVASLLEVGTGFHPELTGRENILLNGAILGMGRVEIKRKFDEIIAFAEVEKFLDTPVKRYSSGMYVRLAFSVAAHLEPEILVVDEVLAVGDGQFQKKCLGKMQQVSKHGRTVLFVTHNMSAVQALCSRVIYLNQGVVCGSGDVEEWIAKYLSNLRQAVAPRLASPVRIGEALELSLFELTPNPTQSGTRVCLSLELVARQPTRLTELAILIYSLLDIRIAIIDLRSCGLPVNLLRGQVWTMRGIVETLPLVEGEYKFGLYAVATDFKGELLNLVALNVSSKMPPAGHAPYLAEHRGVLELEFSSKWQLGRHE